MDPIVFRAVRSIPDLGIDAGDDVVFNPRAPRLFTLCKSVDPGAVLLQYENGALQPITLAPMPSEFSRAVGSPLPSPQPPPGSPRLLRLK